MCTYTIQDFNKSEYTSLNFLTSYVEEYRKLCAEEAEIKAKKQAVRQDIESWLTSRHRGNDGKYFKIQSQDKIILASAVVSYTKYSSFTFDKLALQKVLGQDLSEFQKESKHNRINVK